MTLKKYNSSQLIDVCGKSILDYLAECLSRFNHGDGEVILRATGGNISKGLDVSYMLKREFEGIEVELLNMDEIQLDEEANLVTQYIKIRYNSQLIPKDDMNSSNSKFTSFPVYHLLLDTVLKKSGSLIIKNYYGKKNNQGNKSSEPLIEIHLSNGKTN